MIKAEIISIGNELLSGLTPNTNASWIGQQFHSIGLQVKWITTISDNAEDIEFALKTATERADIIVCTGGLGPTPDDITKNTICEFFKTKLILHENTLKNVKKIFEGRHLKMPETNIGQAMIPEISEALPNPIGTAPGIFIDFENRLYFFLPGVPVEMKNLITPSVIEKIKSKYKFKEINSFLLRTTGIAESRLSEKLEIVQKKYPQHQIAFLPKSTGVDIRLKGEGVGDHIQQMLADIKDVAGKYIYTEVEEELSEVLGRILKEKKITLSTAESFTGGLISDWITNIPGSSDYFLTGITTYSNESKIKQLRVSEDTLKKYGAVSEQTAKEMVVGIKKLAKTDCAISSTGIAGPTGATETKPVGLCYLAASYKNDTIVRKYKFGKDRRFNKERGAISGLELLRRLILDIQ